MTSRMPSIVPKSKAYTSGSSGAASSNIATDVDGWDGLTLEYSIDWPLQLFFSQEVLSK